MGTALVEGSVGGAIKMQQQTPRTQPFLEIDPSGLLALMSKDFSSLMHTTIVCITQD